ncbi:hypothetical protein D9J29_16895 [Escherichia coli]|nr:hypothetical protein [Escherichia coli]
MSIKNDGHYFCRAGGNRPDGLNEPVTVIGQSTQNDTYASWWVVYLPFLLQLTTEHNEELSQEDIFLIQLQFLYGYVSRF